MAGQRSSCQRDRLCVALRRPFDGTLSAPSRLMEQLTDVVAMIAHAKGVGDNLRHPQSCPDVAAIPMRFGASRLQGWLLCPLLDTQSRCPSGRWTPPPGRDSAFDTLDKGVT